MAEVAPSKYTVRAGWDDVPHLSDRMKKEMLGATPPYLRDARSKGTPSLGAGAIYPIPWEDVSVPPRPIPEHWQRGYALDVGWNKTAALWGAQDPESSTIYIYTEHYVGQSLPAVHAEAIKARGDWIIGAIDPAARGRSQRDGETLMGEYTNLGLHLKKADNGVTSGIEAVWSGLAYGTIKIFSHLSNLEAEYMLYRRDENGKIIKKKDHLMDCLRYLIATWKQIASVRPISDIPPAAPPAADALTGY